jgi:hypothetical protein
MLEHGVPSQLRHGGGGGGGSAVAAGASEIAAAAAPRNSADVIFESFTVMQFGYHARRLSKPVERLTDGFEGCRTTLIVDDGQAPVRLPASLENSR